MFHLVFGMCTHLEESHMHGCKPSKVQPTSSI
jgi:hypothetical protein